MKEQSEVLAYKLQATLVTNLKRYPLVSLFGMHTKIPITFVHSKIKVILRNRN